VIGVAAGILLGFVCALTPIWSSPLSRAAALLVMGELMAFCGWVNKSHLINGSLPGFLNQCLIYVAFECAVIKQPSHSMCWHAMIHNAVMCYAVLCYATLCYAMLCYAMLCYAVLCCAVLCRAMLCCDMLCHAMLCYAMPCHAMLCHVRSTSSGYIVLL